MTHTAYISIGSNIGNRLANLRDAIIRLGEAGTVTRRSSWYETEPLEFTAQPWFVNGVLEVRTQLSAEQLMRRLLEIERAMGRERTQAKGPRKIDLDLLLFDDEIVNTGELTLPHPAMHERRFVLAPLAEIAPGVMHPQLCKTAWDLLKNLPEGQEVKRIDEQTE